MLRVITMVTAGCVAVTSADVSLHKIVSIPLDRGAEIVAFDHQLQQVFVIGGSGSSVYSLSDRRLLSTHPMSYSPDNKSAWEPTSIDIDPMGRGFGVIAWIPPLMDRMSHQGVLQIFDTSTFETLATQEIGYHPDCVMFTPDGMRLLIANECEPNELGDHPGGLSVVDFSEVSLSALSTKELAYQFYDFADSLDSFEQLRVSETNKNTPEFDIEPEYLAPTSDGVWVSLQENNGLAYFDFALARWTKMINLGTSSSPLDPLDNGTADIHAGLGIEMLYQPDTIAQFETQGRSYLLLANEGEGDDQDVVEYGQALSLGMLDLQHAEKLIQSFTPHDRDALRKLRISTIDGDTDGDGDIDTPTIMGARGISTLDANSGKMIWESREQLELISALLSPDLYNHGDTRSDRSGPEPEGLAIGYVGDRVLGFVGLERAHMIFMYDLTNPFSLELLDVVMLDESCYPEGLKFIDFEGNPYLFVAAERCEELLIYELKAK